MSGTDERAFEALLEGLAPRPQPPPAVEARVRAAVEREWRRHKRRRWHLPAGLAAALLLALTAAYLVTRPVPGITVEIAEAGDLWVDGALHDRAGEVTVVPGATLETDAGSRLLLSEKAEMRLRAGTRIELNGPAALTLESGALYVRTRDQGRLQIDTPFGTVSNVGTAFMVTVDGDALEVAMREGVTHIETRHGVYTAKVRDRLGDVVRVDGRRLSAGREPVSAERWQWIHDLHPGYAQRQVAALLRQIADDLGLVLSFTDPEVEAAAAESRLEGDLSGLTPSEALTVVLGASGLARADGDQLAIEFQSPADTQ